MSPLPPGSKLGRFELSTVLGQGAMGVVYLANDPQIDRPVAIKTVRPEAGRGEGVREIVYDRTTGAVEFSVEPPEIVVSEGGKTLGAASGFGAGSPLTLRGPAVHDLVLAAPGYRPRLVRILVAANAGKDRARVKEKLKPD